jgi:SAM-dependent methyltransferase
MGDLERRPIGEHDWHSADYVRQWIERDVTRDSERLPLLRQMLTIAPFARDAQIKALDVGAGYGLLSQQVLELFPQAHVTLQDYSAPMFEYARQRLAKYRTRISFARGDLRNPEWDRELECPFDLIVSGLPIHNLRAPSLMQSCAKPDSPGSNAPGSNLRSGSSLPRSIRLSTKTQKYGVSPRPRKWSFVTIPMRLTSVIHFYTARIR